MEFFLRDDYIFSHQGDCVALYNEEDTSPLAYRIVQGLNSTWAASVRNTIGVESEVTFGGGFPMPFQFSVEVHYDTGGLCFLERYDIRGGIFSLLYMIHYVW